MTDAATEAPAATHDTAGPGPLAGVRIVELGMLLAGPFTGRLLGDMGAEVIKVEPPGQPDPLREWGKARYEGRSLWWPVQSRNKKCVTLNLRAEQGQKLLLELVKHADVADGELPSRDARALEPRPGAALGGEPEARDRAHLRLRADRPVRAARRLRVGRPRRWAASATSTASPASRRRACTSRSATRSPGMYAAQGILAALYRRDALGLGRGQVIDVSLLEASFSLLESTVPEYDRLGIVRGPGGTGLKGVAPSNIFKSSDDKWVVIAANADNVFRRLCEAMGQPELADDPRFSTHLARGDHQEEIEGIVADWAGARDAAEIDRVLNEAGVICGPIYTIADIFEDEHFRARDMLLEHDDPEFGTYLGPRVRAQVLRDAVGAALVGALAGGKPQRRRVLRPAWPVPDGPGRPARAGRDLMIGRKTVDRSSRRGRSSRRCVRPRPQPGSCAAIVPRRPQSDEWSTTLRPTV